ncbi:MAG: hypothetical protein ABFC84_05510 [Veillonellales bacterium]
MENIIDLYRKNYQLYSKFTNKVQELLTSLFVEKNIHIHLIASRVKKEASLKNKINRKKYTDIQDITDLCGIRIITYFEDDIEQVSKIIQNTFVVDQVNSVDKRKLLAPTQFGYLSLHYVVSLKSSQLHQSEYEIFKNCKIEIQIRTILQHAWAEIEHDLEYKPQIAISYDARRSFSRLASLLELADIEFRRLRDKLQPSPCIVPNTAHTSLALLPESKNEGIIPKKVIKKLAFLKALGAKCAESIGCIPLKKTSGYAFAGIIFTVCLAHLTFMSHLISPIIAALKTEKALFLLLANV